MREETRLLGLRPERETASRGLGRLPTALAPLPKRLPHGVVSVPRKFWTCPKGCGGRWERSLVKCRTEGCTGRRPKKRVPRHAHTLRDDSWEHYDAVNAAIHGVTDGSCAVCGRPEHESMHHHREHDHLTGKPRGLVCFQCNRLMPILFTVERARQCLAYLERVEAYYRQEEVACAATTS